MKICLFEGACMGRFENDKNRRCDTHHAQDTLVTVTLVPIAHILHILHISHISKRLKFDVVEK